MSTVFTETQPLSVVTVTLKVCVPAGNAETVIDAPVVELNVPAPPDHTVEV